jgi:hypothetical protein
MSKRCKSCGSNHTSTLGSIDYDKILEVDEAYEHLLQEPSNAQNSLTNGQMWRLFIIFSMFFTPFAAPFMVLLVKIMYEGGVDAVRSRAIKKSWAQNLFCYQCGKVLDDQGCHV